MIHFHLNYSALGLLSFYLSTARYITRRIELGQNCGLTTPCATGLSCDVCIENIFQNFFATKLSPGQNCRSHFTGNYHTRAFAAIHSIFFSPFLLICLNFRLLIYMCRLKISLLIGIHG